MPISSVSTNRCGTNASSQALIAGRDRYTKIIVFAATVQHARDLHVAMKHSRLVDHYDSPSITSRAPTTAGAVPRSNFFTVERATKRSILINVEVVIEGY